MKYMDLYNDRQIKDKFQIIDLNNNNYIQHGLQHTHNVVDNIKKLSSVLKVDNETRNYLIIAGYLHDIGRAIEKENHCLKGKEFVEEYLKNKIENKWLIKYCHQ